MNDLNGVVSKEDIIGNKEGKKGKKLVIKKAHILNKLEQNINSIRISPTRIDMNPIYASIVLSAQCSPKNMKNITIPADNPSNQLDRR